MRVAVKMRPMTKENQEDTTTQEPDLIDIVPDQPLPDFDFPLTHENCGYCEVDRHSHSAWLRSQSDKQLRMLIQMLSRNTGLRRS
jgi:hypothetical protein